MSIKRTSYKGLSFPEDETYLTVRPCFTAICMDNKPAAKLLSALLFKWNPGTETDVEQTITFSVQRTQDDLVKDLCGECTSKTIHDVAVPGLQLFKYLDVDESTYPFTYTVHLDRVRSALASYKLGLYELEKVLIAWIEEQQLEEVPFNKKKFYLLLEKVLIRNRISSNCFRKSSNSRRGPKPRQQAASLPQNETPKNIRINKNIQEQKEESVEAHAVNASSLAFSVSQQFIHTHSQAEDEPFVCNYNGTHYALCPEENAPDNVAVDSHAHSQPQEQHRCVEETNTVTEVVTRPDTPLHIVSSVTQTTLKQEKKQAEQTVTKAKPVMPPADAKWGTRTCMQMFDAWRGAPLMAQYKIQQASSTCKALAETYTRQQIEQVYEAMVNDPYWIDKGGVEFHNVANNMARELKKLERKPASRDHLKVVPVSEVRPDVLVSVEQRQKNKDKLYAMAEARNAAQQS